MSTMTAVVNPLAGSIRPANADGILVSVILPAFNEAPALPTVLEDVFASLGEVGPHEVIVVDDASTDDTALIASGFPCRLLQHKVNQGKGAALRTGFRAARGQYVVVMDADATYPAAAIPQMVSLLAQHDLVRGIRKSNGESMPIVNRVGNAIFDALLTRVLRLGDADPLSGLYGMRREMWQRMDLESAGFDIEVEIGIKARSLGLSCAALPIAYHPRVGEKKLDAWQDGWCILSRILAMALLHNPALTFVVPGLCVTLLAVIAAFVLSGGPLITPYLGLSTNSFILAALGVLAGFQLLVFGVAAQLYAVEEGYRPRLWLLRLSSRRVRLGGAALGALLMAAGLIVILDLALSWTLGGAGEFTQTRPLVLAAVSLVLGLQVISAALFVSIFAGRLSHRMAQAQ